MYFIQHIPIMRLSRTVVKNLQLEEGDWILAVSGDNRQLQEIASKEVLGIITRKIAKKISVVIQTNSTTGVLELVPVPYNPEI